MRAYQKSKRLAGKTKHAPAPQPLDDGQLDAVMRNVFAWMTVGFGVTATVASVLLANPINLDRTVSVFILFAHLAIAFMLDRRLRRFSPTQAGAFFIFYAALTGFTLSAVFAALFDPTVSPAVVNASTSVGCLFGLMTLLGRATRLDLGRARSYVLMALLGLIIAYLANRLLAGAFFDYSFSFFSVLLFSALVGGHRDAINALASDPDLRIKPADSLRFSLLAALQLYVTVGNMIAIALSSGPLRRSRGGHYYHHLPHHHQSHHSAMGIGAGGISGGGGIGGGGGGGGSVGGGGGSFTP